MIIGGCWAAALYCWGTGSVRLSDLFTVEDIAVRLGVLNELLFGKRLVVGSLRYAGRVSRKLDLRGSQSSLGG